MGSGFSYSAPTSLSKEEMSLLVKDLNPMQQKMLTENPDQKKQLTEELSRLLSIAKQAEKEGITAQPLVKSELQFIRNRSNREQLRAKDRRRQETPEAKKENPMEQKAPFASVTEVQVKEFLGRNRRQTRNS